MKNNDWQKHIFGDIQDVYDPEYQTPAQPPAQKTQGNNFFNQYNKQHPQQHQQQQQQQRPQQRPQQPATKEQKMIAESAQRFAKFSKNGVKSTAVTNEQNEIETLREEVSNLKSLVEQLAEFIGENVSAIASTLNESVVIDANSAQSGVMVIGGQKFKLTLTEMR